MHSTCLFAAACVASHAQEHHTPHSPIKPCAATPLRDANEPRTLRVLAASSAINTPRSLWSEAPTPSSYAPQAEIQLPRADDDVHAALLKYLQGKQFFMGGIACCPNVDQSSHPHASSFVSVCATGVAHCLQRSSLHWHSVVFS